MLHLIKASSLPIDACAGIQEPHQATPIIACWVDVSDRPDVKSLMERSLTDEFQFKANVMMERPGHHQASIWLDIRFIREVETHFALGFALKDYAQVLEVLGQYGRVLIIEGPAPDPDSLQRLLRPLARFYETLKGRSIMATLPPEACQMLRDYVGQWQRIR